MKTNTHKIIFVAVDGIQSLDLFGPLEVFAAANDIAGSPYEWQIASFSQEPVTTESGTKILPDVNLSKNLQVDTLVFCGGQGARTSSFNQEQIDILNNLCQKAERIVGICTGAFIISQLGIADDKHIATHWQHIKELESSNEKLLVDNDALFVQDGKIWTSAGVTAGIDLALALVSIDYGQSVSTSVARHLVVYIRRTGGQSQFSEPLKLQSNDAGRIAPILEWIMQNLSENITVDRLASMAGLSTRQFTRLFKATTQYAPAKYIEHIRLDKARLILTQGHHRISEIAYLVGYSNSDSFRRAFERKFSITPSLYKKQFTNEHPNHSSEKE